MDIPGAPGAAPAPGTPAKEAREGEGPSSKKRTMEEDVQHLVARRPSPGPRKQSRGRWTPRPSGSGRQ